MATLKNNSRINVSVRGKLLRPGESVNVDEPSRAERLMFGLDDDKVEVAKTEPAKTEPAKTEPAKK